jgi:hypothetical protein
MIIFTSLNAGAQQNEPGPNWLYNPGGEIQPVTNAGWRQTAGDWTKPKGAVNAHGGQSYFWGGASAEQSSFKIFRSPLLVAGSRMEQKEPWSART